MYANCCGNLSLFPKLFLISPHISSIFKLQDCMSEIPKKPGVFALEMVDVVLTGVMYHLTFYNSHTWLRDSLHFLQGWGKNPNVRIHILDYLSHFLSPWVQDFVPCMGPGTSNWERNEKRSLPWPDSADIVWSFWSALARPFPWISTASTMCQ